MNHIIISPHLDDAVLCCGGMIAKFIAAGDTVTNQTIFCGPAQPPYSPLASSFHERWGNPKNMVRLRRAEDRAAGAKLGIRVVHGERFEPIYRVDEQGRWLYHEIEDIFSPRNTADDHLVEELSAGIGGDAEIVGSRLYFPLGIGHHVDHIIMFEVGQALLQQGHDVVFYEDFPYTVRDNNFEQRRAELPAFQSVTVPLSLEEMNAKIEAFLYYRSQIPMLFQTFNNVPGMFMNFGRSVTGDGQSFGERLWFNPEFNNPFKS
jgi:GlcNAc-PI de-N-acetylase